MHWHDTRILGIGSAHYRRRNIREYFRDSETATNMAPPRPLFLGIEVNLSLWNNDLVEKRLSYSLRLRHLKQQREREREKEINRVCVLYNEALPERMVHWDCLCLGAVSSRIPVKAPSHV